MSVTALTIRAVRAKHLIRAKGIEPSTSGRNGGPMCDKDPDTVHTEESDLPEGLSRESGPLDKSTGQGNE